MSTGRRLPLAEARQVALAIAAELRPACVRVEIAGSVRRRAPDAGDLELVVEPRYRDGDRVDLFAPAPKVSELDAQLVALALAGRLVAHPERPAAGEKYKRLWAPKAGIQVDLFIVTPPAQFAVLYLIRTGPAEFSKRVVTALLPRGLRCEQGAIWRGSEIVPCPDEETFFRLAGMEPLEPARRK